MALDYDKPYMVIDVEIAGLEIVKEHLRTVHEIKQYLSRYGILCEFPIEEIRPVDRYVFQYHQVIPREV